MSVAPQCCLGVDVGGTKIAAGLAGLPEGNVLARRTIPTNADRGGRAVLDDVVRLAGELTAEAADLGHPVAAIGLGLCELVDHRGRIASANCLPWMNEPVIDRLATIAPAHLEADVRAAALAESALGAGRTFRVFLYVTIGTGISCCLMLDGQPYLGANGATGTMASSAIRVPCEHGDAMTGRTLEELASGPALVNRFNAAGGQAARGHDVLTAVGAGDPTALRVVRSAAEALGSQVGMLVGTLDPQAVILGGGLGLSEGLFWDELVAAIRRHIWSEQQRDLPICRAATGADAGWLGAAIAASRRQSLVS